MPCEGRLVAVVPAVQAQAALSALKGHKLGQGAAVIGVAVSESKGLVLATTLGGHRPLVPLEGAQIPRIC